MQTLTILDVSKNEIEDKSAQSISEGLQKNTVK